MTRLSLALDLADRSWPTGLLKQVYRSACWNAESQLQRRHYGENRRHGCALLPARYDLLATALGGHGELVEAPDQLEGAIARAIGSGKPAVINVMTESIAAPVLRLGSSLS